MKLAKSRGQNTVEYLMMLAVIVGVILVVGRMFKPQVSNVFNKVMQMVTDAANTVGGA
ncbi:MAG: class III signal peptide-containing protein [Elusimicrobia bacterium]|nr:class III signal peptide-containing protein [Elusimicrobiota bacterium]